ncbi:ABC transporter substrate-binding protein [Rouxiella badensis]|uniref:ABC transporter substrate-binding protein n=1 Tax=Rouxiella badensis TaxID=1646377 RepID=UPI001D13CC4B|nr:ABC transporter substrate-binding protein [Rouxiella badensis]MCC3719351.1 ABC transporter substrate-binding protein [Rouxiella badensis]MCC3728601.1 ABC transporter substrate-binding protein [Rouxiella badensis]MCC3734366.1 ABC transporter substrate-binding protein [Rouxiella badensis]MCC3739403.1 ABC transporter substrate-binding protein [Rouxiella badensis]MCC3758904.1 ABC transporter substrate-binding protein [Rouxiella badensis]
MKYSISAISLLVISALHPLYAADNSPQTPQQGGDFIWGIETNPTTLNPQFNGQTKVELVQRAAFESLLARKADGSYIPWLATGYEISKDHKTYTFHLRQDVKFSNGEKFNAAAVAENFKNLQNLTYCAGSTMCVIGSRIANIATPDDYTVVVTLKAVYSPFLSYISWLKLISPSSWKAADLKSGGTDIAGTGPFILKRWDKNQQIVFVRNPDYHWSSGNAAHQGPAYLNSITYRILPESSVRTGALLSGQVDAIEGISGNDAGEFIDNPDYSYQSAPNTGTPYSLFLNVKDGPTQELNVRQALLQGLDVAGILTSIYRGHRIHSWGITSPIDPLYDKSIEGKYGNNPQLANKLLDEAGWTTKGSDGIRSKNGVRLSILVVQSQVTVRDQRDVLLEALQAQARQRLGIELKIRYVDPGTYFQYIKNGNYGSIANSHDDTDGLDIENHYLPINAGGAINYSRTDDPKVSAWLNEAAQTLDEAKRKAIYSQLQNYALLQQALVIPLYAPDDEIAAASYVHGIGFRTFRQIPENAYDVWVSKH